MEDHNRENLGEKYTLRAATSGDRDKAKDIHHRAYKEIIERQFGEFDEKEQDKYFEDAWSHPHELIIVGDEIAGYVNVEKKTATTFFHRSQLILISKEKELQAVLLRP